MLFDGSCKAGKRKNRGIDLPAAARHDRGRPGKMETNSPSPRIALRTGERAKGNFV
jgi:hypothetical protein